MAYVHAVHASGGRAVLVTQDDPGTDVLDDLDGIIFTGGADVAPALYGEDAARAHGHPAGPGRRRAAAAARRDRGRPADARDLPGHAADGRRVRRPAATSTCPTCSATTGTGPTVRSEVRRTAPGAVRARLGSAIGCSAPSTTVNSFHHQGVADVGQLTADRLGAGRHRVPGGVPEPRSRPWRTRPAGSRIGVQWHPEDTDDFRLFEALVAAASRRIAAPGANARTPADPRCGPLSCRSRDAGHAGAARLGRQ